MPEDRWIIYLMFALLTLIISVSFFSDGDKFAEGSANEIYNQTGTNVSNEGPIVNLISRLETGSHESQLDAAAELGQMGQPAADTLIEKIENKAAGPGKINNYMLLALLETGDKRAEDVLLRSLQEKEAGWKAVNSKAKEDERGEISEDMLQAIEAKDKALRKHIASSLNIDYREKTDELEEALTSEEQDYNAYASIALSESGAQEPGNETEKLLKALKSKDGNIRLAAIMALGEGGEEAAVEPINQILTRDYPLIRKSAAFALGKIGSDRAVEVLLKEMKSSEEEKIRSSAAISLGKMGSEESVPYLIERLREGKVDVRSSAALALGMVGDETAVEPLIEVLESGKAEDGRLKSALNTKPEVRKSVVLALGEIGSKEATETLIDVLLDEEEDQEVRKAAAAALGKIGDPEVVDTLSRVLNDAETPLSIKTEVIPALGKIEDRKAAETLIVRLDDEKFASSARNALAGMGEAAVEPLIECLSCRDETLKTEAALLLIEIGDERAVEPLIQAYRQL
ncbi:putative oxidoreductase/HEAT repeat-containing protein [Methanosarcina sp. MTP4]|nr:putative oxidoreductase/HEAT repeat-containing protein [Methanosarcina sp. MTP4]